MENIEMEKIVIAKLSPSFSWAEFNLNLKLFLLPTPEKVVIHQEVNTACALT